MERVLLDSVGWCFDMNALVTATQCQPTKTKIDEEKMLGTTLLCYAIIMYVILINKLQYCTRESRKI